MTSNQFNAECATRLIDVVVALENADIKNALMEKDDQLVIELLNSEF